MQADNTKTPITAKNNITTSLYFACGFKQKETKIGLNTDRFIRKGPCNLSGGNYGFWVGSTQNNIEPQTLDLLIN